MIKGIGVDMVHVPRCVDKHAKLSHRVLTPNEWHHYESLDESRKVEFFASRFAIKEAYYKACGTKDMGYHSVEIAQNESGKPYIVGSQAHVSLSHDGEYVIAFVVVEEK